MWLECGGAEWVGRRSLGRGEEPDPAGVCGHGREAGKSRNGSAAVASLSVHSEGVAKAVTWLSQARASESCPEAVSSSLCVLPELKPYFHFSLSNSLVDLIVHNES